MLEIWNWLATENGVPRRKSLTPRLLRTHLANVAIYECVEDGRWRARLMGQRFTEVLGNFAGKFFDEVMTPSLVTRWHAAPQAAIDARVPLRFVSRSETAGKGHITGEYLVAPLAGDDGDVNTVLSCGIFGATFAAQDCPLAG